MSDQLRRLEQWVAPLLAKLTPAERRKLAGRIARDLRRRQQQRIITQRNPDGSPFEPRKPQNRQQRGRIRRLPMFMKIRRAAHLRTKGQPNAAEVGFVGRIAQIARVHHYGLRDRVRPGGPDYQYPSRELLGYSEADLRMISDTLIDHLTPEGRARP
ncbi:MAG: phage virion morphogenesis protein [Billgrantia sp.]